VFCYFSKRTFLKATLNAASDIIELKLTPDQIQAVAPIVRQAVSDWQNVLFVGTCVPDLENGQPIWRSQIKPIKATAARRVVKVIADASKEDAHCKTGK
jgi:hypothetical protein